MNRMSPGPPVRGRGFSGVGLSDIAVRLPDPKRLRELRLQQKQKRGLLPSEMQLLLARHGNTFGPDDPVVWVGKKNDLALVERGREQAHALAEALRTSGGSPIEIRHGPLRRTREFARIIADELGVDRVGVDHRLDELDYGKWSGLTSAQIEKKYGKRELRDWSERSIWPRNAAWGGSESIVRREVRSLVAELRENHADQPGDARVLLVSSNGRLRYFLDLVAGAFERHVQNRDFAVATGRVCRIDLARDACTSSAIRYWNLDPARPRRRGGESL